MDAPLFAGARIEGLGQRYRGRVKAAPQVGVSEVRVELEGPSAKLDDPQWYRFLGVHSDLTAWQSPSVARREALLFTGVQVQENGGVEQDKGGLPSLATRLVSPWATDSTSEFWLTVDGMPIGELRGYWAKGNNVDHTSAHYGWYVGLSDDDSTQDETSANLRGIKEGAVTETASTSTRIFAFVRLLHADTITAFQGYPFDVYWPALSVFGMHGLAPTLISDPPHPDYSVTRYGLEGSDMLRYIVEDSTDLVVGPEFETNTFAFPHFVHTGPPRQAVEAITALGGLSGQLNDWGVYDYFFWSSPGTVGRTWRVRRDQVATPTDEGLSAEELCKGVVVTYSKGVGDSASVGPPGSGADTEDASLLDTSPNNPAPDERIIVRDGGITTEAGAILIGQAILAEQNSLTRLGSVSLTGWVEDDGGNKHPASAVRACDRIIVTDDQRPTTMPIVSTSYTHDTATTTAQLGAAPHRVDALLARLLAVTPA
jgi:hypothetical protein